MIRAAAVGAGLAFCLFAGAGLLLQWVVVALVVVVCVVEGD